jgi:hypothetical protein
MITLKLKPWVPIAGLVHDKTSWQVAEDILFENILDDVKDSIEYLNIYFSNVVVPEGNTYYIRAKRHYNNDTYSSWSAPIPVVAKVDDSNLLITNDVIIDTPSIYVDAVQIKDSESPYFDIETSLFKSTTEGHFATTWIIKDGSGKILLSDIFDVDNLTNIRIMKSDVDLTNISIVNIHVIHMTASGICSEVANKTLLLTDELYNYEVDNDDLQRIMPNADYIIKFSKVNDALPYGITKLTIKNAFGDGPILFSKDMLITDNTVLIPGSVLQPDTSYLFTLVGYSSQGQQANNIVVKTTLSSELENINTSYVYENDFSFVYDTSDRVIGSDFITHEWHNSQIPVPMSDGTIHKFKWDRATDRLVDLGVLPELILSNAGRNVYIKLLENNRIIIDRISDNGIPVFDVYTHNPSTDEIRYVHSIHRVHEKDTVGKTGGIIHTDNDTAIYLVPGENKLRKVNFVTKIITDVTSVPLTNIGYGTIINTNDDKIIILGGTDGVTKLYDITDNRFVDGPRMPIDFRNKDLQAVKLVNNDTVIFRTNFIDGENNDFLIYNANSDSIDIVEVVNHNNATTDTSILLRTGGVLRSLVDPDTNTTYIYKLK